MDKVATLLNVRHNQATVKKLLNSRSSSGTVTWCPCPLLVINKNLLNSQSSLALLCRFQKTSLFRCCCCRNSVLVAATIISCLSIVMLYSHVKFNLWILAKSLSAFVQSAVDAKCRRNISPQCQCTRSIAFLHLNMLLSSQVNLVLNCLGCQICSLIAVDYCMNAVPEILAQNAPLLIYL